MQGKLKSKIKAEYIAGEVSYRELAEKYNVSESTLRKTASKEKWKDSRNEARTKAGQKVVEKVAEEQAKGAVLIDRINNTLLEAVADDIEKETMTAAKADVYSKVFDALRKAKQIGDYRSKRELEEQMARIEKMRAETALAKSKITSDSSGTGRIELIIK